MGLRKIGKPGCVAFSHVDKTAAKLPRFGEELNSIARISAGITCGAIRPACGAALGWRLVHLNAETVNEFRHHALHLRNKHDSVRATAAQPVLHGDCGGHQRVDRHHSEEQRPWVDEICSSTTIPTKATTMPAYAPESMNKGQKWCKFKVYGASDHCTRCQALGGPRSVGSRG
jgi:hypothetical protein